MTQASDDQKNQGRGWYGDPKKHADSGRQGGISTARKYRNTTFYQDIGRRGGKAAHQNRQSTKKKSVDVAA